MTSPNIPYLPKTDLIVGEYYICAERNFSIGRWNGIEFEYLRDKFGSTFTDTKQHWDDGPPHGTIKPIRHIEVTYED